jgi:hypothetical protein
MVSPYHSLPHALRQFEVRHSISLLGRAEVTRRGWPCIHQRPVHVGLQPEAGPVPELRVGVRSTSARPQEYYAIDPDRGVRGAGESGNQGPAGPFSMPAQELCGQG